MKKAVILFLPYKYAMADSLESIWFAALEASACEVKICPIPYYDKLPNGSFGDLHDEYDFYDKTLPLVKWRDLNIEELKPDAIFIHNPYDAGNKVTSVHPDFYAKRLRKSTKTLCYVPYFVVGQDTVSPDLAINSAVLYSNKVFVQSEKIRKSYIDNITYYEAENKCKGVFGNLETKIVALGSPKFDKVFDSIPNDYILPDEWKNIVYKPDGKKKKIILYNTSIAGILAGKEQYLKKIRYTIESFKMQHNDVVLWWRPHPLSEKSFSSMRHKLSEEYRRIVSDYKRENYGIYDDTADFHRAIAISDAYFGDKSSVVPLYTVTGKPVMIQNVSFLSENFDGMLITLDCSYDDGENIWASSMICNALFRVSKEVWQAEYVGSFPKEEMKKHSLFRSVIKIEDKLVFCPFSAKSIGIYNLTNGEFSGISLEDTKSRNYIQYNSYSKFSAFVKCNNDVWMFPATYPKIVKLSVENGNLEYFTVSLPHKSEVFYPLFSAYFGVNAAQFVNGVIYAPLSFANSVLILDTLSNKIRLHSLKESTAKGFSRIAFDGKYFWLSPRIGSDSDYKEYICKWDGVSKYTENIYLPQSDNRKILPFRAGVLRKMVYITNTLILYLSSRDEVLEFNTLSNEFKVVQEEAIPKEPIKLINLSEFNTICLVNSFKDNVLHSDFCYFEEQMRNIKTYIDIVKNGKHSDEISKSQKELAIEKYVGMKKNSGKQIYNAVNMVLNHQTTFVICEEVNI
ncbi:MAG: CDP-glycerol glycerophosphotransferase family protein [Clostridiales bacterium]|nr:CDP-glycerol glycerophosphotransferase family protein [Clostridiales bacterium]